MKLIGITGYARSGKNTFADCLQKCSIDIQQFSFAAEIKYCVGEIFGREYIDWFADERKDNIIPKYGKSPRQLAILVGTELGRKVHPDLWVEKLEATIKERDIIHGGREISVITDVRFQNEVDWILHNKGLIYVVKKPGIGPANEHISEAIHDLDFYGKEKIVDNSSTIEELQAKANYILIYQIPRHFGL